MSSSDNESDNKSDNSNESDNSSETKKIPVFKNVEDSIHYYRLNDYRYDDDDNVISPVIMSKEIWNIMKNYDGFEDMYEYIDE